MLPSVGDASGREALLYATLRDLLAIEATELWPALDEAAGLIAQVLNADAVDVFLYDASTDCLVAVCTPASALGTRQRDSGLDRLPLASGGLVVKIFRSGGSYRTGQADRDPDERQDVVEVLEIRSALLCRLQANGDARGVLQAMSRQPNYFLEIDQLFLQAATRWMGLVARRAELTDQIARDAVQAGRRLAAEQLQRLSLREREVAVLVARGMTNEEVAERLVLVPGTVSNHVQHILRKLAFTRRVQIATWSVQNGLWSPDGTQSSLPPESPRR